MCVGGARRCLWHAWQIALRGKCVCVRGQEVFEVRMAECVERRGAGVSSLLGLGLVRWVRSVSF